VEGLGFSVQGVGARAEGSRCEGRHRFAFMLRLRSSLEVGARVGVFVKAKEGKKRVC